MSIPLYGRGRSLSSTFRVRLDLSLGTGEGFGVMGEYHLMAPCKGLVTILWREKIQINQIYQLILYVKGCKR